MGRSTRSGRMVQTDLCLSNVHRFTNLVQLSEGKLSKMETAKNMASCWWEKKVSDDELKDEI